MRVMDTNPDHSTIHGVKISRHHRHALAAVLQRYCFAHPRNVAIDVDVKRHLTGGECFRGLWHPGGVPFEKHANFGAELQSSACGHDSLGEQYFSFWPLRLENQAKLGVVFEERLTKCGSIWAAVWPGEPQHDHQVRAEEAIQSIEALLCTI